MGTLLQSRGLEAIHRFPVTKDAEARAAGWAIAVVSVLIEQWVHGGILTHRSVEAWVEAGRVTIEGIENEITQRLGQRQHAQLRSLLTKLLERDRGVEANSDDGRAARAPGRPTSRPHITD